MKKPVTIVWAIGVIVVIFGCLGAIAAPKSGLFTNKCKPRQSEAKTHLSGIFTAEKVFFGEYGYYTTDLVAIQWTPDGKTLYAYGFAQASARAKDERLEDLDPTRRTTLDERVKAKGGYSLEKTITHGGRALTDADFQKLAPAAIATSNGFLAAAIGDVDDDGSEERFDVWTIDHEKTLTAISNDCLD